LKRSLHQLPLSVEMGCASAHVCSNI